MDAKYYRQQAERGRRLAHVAANSREIAKPLEEMAKQYDEIADDLETGAAQTRHV